MKFTSDIQGNTDKWFRTSLLHVWFMDHMARSMAITWEFARYAVFQALHQLSYILRSWWFICTFTFEKHCSNAQETVWRGWIILHYCLFFHHPWDVSMIRATVRLYRLCTAQRWLGEDEADIRPLSGKKGCIFLNLLARLWTQGLWPPRRRIVLICTKAIWPSQWPWIQYSSTSPYLPFWNL